jgi:hypothetical protein
MPIDPLAPFALNPAEAQADKNADLNRRIAALERRPMLDRASWQSAALINGFQNSGAPYAPAGFYIDSQGLVHLRGRVSQGSDLAPVTMFVLSQGFRPAYRHEFPTSANFADSVTQSLISVLANGNVVLELGDAGFGFPVNLDPIYFRVI